MLARIDASAKAIALVVDESERLLNTITDGDIRRGLLAGVGLDEPIARIVDRRGSPPITAPVNASRAELLEIMQRHKVRHLPVIDGDMRVVDLAQLEKVIEQPPMEAIVMAGGFGTRLLPLTEHRPKPLLPVGDRPLLDHLLAQLKVSGVTNVHITTHHFADQIREHLIQKNDHGLLIDYVHEDSPLGTAGSLASMPRPAQPTLVVNADLLTNLNFSKMLAFHEEQDAIATVALRKYELAIPYGVVTLQDASVTKIVEKPVQQTYVIAGIYLLDPAVWNYLKRDSAQDMPDLMQAVIADGGRVVGFPISEYWLDIGHPHDYARAQDDLAKGLFS